MKYLFWKLDELGYDGWKEVLEFALKKSDNFNITHSMKENNIDGIKLYSVESENTMNDKKGIWNYIYRSSIEKGDYFFFEYEMNEKSLKVEELINMITGCDVKEVMVDGEHKVKVCRGIIDKEAKNVLDMIIVDEQLGYDYFDWHLEIIDNKIKRTLFSKHNCRRIINGRGYVNAEFTEEEIDEINSKGYVLDNIIDYKRRYTVNQCMDEKYSMMIKDEAFRVSQGEVANLMTIKLYKGDRKIVSTDMEYYFNLCLSEDEMSELNKLNINSDSWEFVMEKEGYIAPNYYMSNECKSRLHFNVPELDVRKIEESVEKFFERMKI